MYMRYLTGLILLFMLSMNAIAEKQLSNQAEISLLTCSPGDELYALFGHSAIRVNDPLAGFDLVFNYGTFDFDTPNFYLKFGNGNLNYWLNYYSYSRFLKQYSYYKQNVTEHQLNFSLVEKQRLFDALLFNAQEENKYYRYDFFFDNCATRIRDIIIDNVDGEVIYVNEVTEDVTFRELLHEYQTHVPWISDGLDIILGMKTDDMANRNDQMYLPEYMEKHFSKANVITNGKTKPLMLQGKTVLSFDKRHGNGGITPAQLFWVIFILMLVVVYYEVKKRKTLVIINRVLLLATGVVGVLIFFLWFLSRHSVTGDNFNMLWAMPFNLFLAFFPSWFYKSKPFKVYLFFMTLCVATLILFGGLLPQFLPAMIVPLALLLFVRYASWLYLMAKN